MMSKNFKKLRLVLAIVALTGDVCAQPPASTASIITEFNKVMSFAVEPYLFYRTETKVTSVPVNEANDTMTLHGIYYKFNTNLYYGNEREEIFVEDSFLIRVSHSRKSIWISKLNMATKDKMYSMPLSNLLPVEKMMDTYIIKKTASKSGTNSITFDQKNEGEYSSSISNSSIVVEYDNTKFLPKDIIMDVHTNVEVNNDIINSYKSGGVNITPLVKIIDGKKYLIKDQKISVAFLNISESREEAGRIPSYKNRISYDISKKEFEAKGDYHGYEIIKTF